MSQRPRKAGVRAKAPRPLAGLPCTLVYKAGRRLIESVTPLAERPLGLAARNIRKTPPSGPTLIVATDLLTCAWRQLFPAERMIVVGGQRHGAIVRATSIRDVTGDTRSLSYVRSAPDALHQALLDWETTGAHVCLWMHCHPGSGPLASYPSWIDRQQDRDLRSTYGDEIVGLIATQDRYIRLWGQAVEAGRRIKFQGQGLEATEDAN